MLKGIKLFFGLGICIMSFSSVATELLFVDHETTNDIERAEPAVTLAELKQRNHENILKSVNSEYRQLSGWNDYYTYCKPVYVDDLCAYAFVNTYVSFVKKSEQHESWYITVNARNNRYGDYKNRAQEAYDNALERAKFSCLGDVEGEGEILSKEDSWDPTYYRITARFKCKKLPK